MPTDTQIDTAYALAKDRYAEYGVDTDVALERLADIPVSINCWGGDDVAGFEEGATLDGAGIMATGGQPGPARNADELRADLQQALAHIPGRHRFNLHAIYLEAEGKVERTDLEPRHFQGWIDFAKQQGLGLDFNPTFFSHPLAADGFTLAHADPTVRQFWIEHGIACRRIGAEMGRQLGSPCVTNVWIPDGWKDLPADRLSPRLRLIESLEALFAEPLDATCNLDAVEAKLFGIGSEAYVAGSHEFYLAWAVRHRQLLCLDAGHFHPTETIADKFSAVAPFVEGLLVHISRGVRWDSDHVPILDDPTQAIATELVRCNLLGRSHIGLDCFDASINRIAAWVIATRTVQQTFLRALLEPIDRLRAMENAGDLTGRLALLEAVKGLPAGAVWDRFCLEQQVAVGDGWMPALRSYGQKVLAER